MEATIGNEKLYPNLLMYVNFEEQFSGLDENKTNGIRQNLELMDLDEEELINTGMKEENQKNEIISNDQNEIITNEQNEIRTDNKDQDEKI